MNRFTIMGNITCDLDLQHTSSDKAMLKFNVAVKRSYPKDGEYLTDFFKCISFGKQAELISQYFSKGSRILLTGEVTIEEYDGKWYTKVIVREFHFIDKKQKEKLEDNDASDAFLKQEKVVDPFESTIDVSDDSLPF